MNFIAKLFKKHSFQTTSGNFKIKAEKKIPEGNVLIDIAVTSKEGSKFLKTLKKEALTTEFISEIVKAVEYAVVDSEMTKIVEHAVNEALEVKKENNSIREEIIEKALEFEKRNDFIREVMEKGEESDNNE